MKAVYRGCDIESKREKCLGGWSEVYWSAYRQSDGYGISDGFGGGTVRECFTGLKEAVDDFLDNYGGDSEKHSNDLRDAALAVAGLK